MSFIPSAESHPISDAQSVAGGHLFEVIQLADSEGNIVDPSGGTPGPVAIDGEVDVRGKAYSSVVTITRPANTTPYAIGQVLGHNSGSGIITLASAGPAGGYVMVQSVSLLFSDSVVPAGMASFRVHLYDASPSAVADGAAFNLVAGERSSYLGFIDLPAPTDLGSTLYSQTDYPGRLAKLAAASTTLFAEIETRGAYTPVSASTITLRVNTLDAGA